MPVGGGKFTLEKTWRASGTGTTTFNAPGNFTLPFGKSVTTVQGRGGTGNPGTTGNISAYNPPSGGSANYNSFTSGNANYNPISPSTVIYNPTSGGNAYFNPAFPGSDYYNPVSGGNPYYNPIVPGNANYNAYQSGTDFYNPVVPGTTTYNSPLVRVEQWVTYEPFTENFYNVFFQNPSPCPTPFGQFDSNGAYIQTYYYCETVPGNSTTNPPTGGNYAGTNAPSGGNFAGNNPSSGGNYAGVNPSSGGNYAGTNPPSGGNVAGYNPISGGNFAGYNPQSGGNLANYNPPSGGNIASYNPSSPGTALYNPSSPAVAGTPSVALGVSMAGGATGTGTYVAPTTISTYDYPDNQTYPVTVGSGGYVQIEVK